MLFLNQLFCIPKILKNESNSQPILRNSSSNLCCFVSQRYWKMKAIHNDIEILHKQAMVVLYPKDTEKWKQFTTALKCGNKKIGLFCIPKILKNESNSQQRCCFFLRCFCCFVSQRYWKMKAIHNNDITIFKIRWVVLYPKDTEKWKQFTTQATDYSGVIELFCIPKILKNESNSQQTR